MIHDRKWSGSPDLELKAEVVSIMAITIAEDCRLNGSKNFNIELREVIVGCCVTNPYDDDTMSPDVDIKVN